MSTSNNQTKNKNEEEKHSMAQPKIPEIKQKETPKQGMFVNVFFKTRGFL